MADREHVAGEVLHFSGAPAPDEPATVAAEPLVVEEVDICTHGQALDGPSPAGVWA